MGIFLNLKIHHELIARVDVEDVEDHLVGSKSSVSNVHHIHPSVAVKSVNRKRGRIVVVSGRLQAVQVDCGVQAQGWKDVADNVAREEHHFLGITQPSFWRDWAVFVLAGKYVRPNFFLDALQFSDGEPGWPYGVLAWARSHHCSICARLQESSI